MAAADLKHSIPVCKPHLPTTVFGLSKTDEGYYARTYREQFAGFVSPPPKQQTDDAEKPPPPPPPLDNGLPPTVEKPIDRPTEADRLRTEIDRLKNELRSMHAELNRTKTVKGIKPACTVSVVFVDCKHACCCRRCAEQLAICPICRAAVRHAAAVIFS
jgi:hypothetical protein